MKNSLFIPLFSILIACSGVNKSALDEVNTLQKKLTNLEQGFSSVDVKELGKAKKQYDESIGLIKKYYFKDTIDVKFMNSLDYYKNIKYSFKNIIRNKLIVKDNLDIAKKQLKDLETDLNNAVIQGEQLEKALENERRNMAKLDSAVTSYIKNAETITIVHDSIAAYVKNQTLSF